jgi:O-antigen ligase
MVVYFARPEDWIPGLGSLPLAKITGVLILVVLAFSFNGIHWHIPSEITFLCLLIIQLWISVALSPVWKGGAFNVMMNFSKALPLVFVIYATVRSIHRLRWILFVQAASVAAVAIASVLKSHGSSGRLQGVLSGTYGNSNDFALVIDISLPICLALALTTRSYWKKIVWIGVMLTMIYAVILTASRAGAIALVVAAVVCLWHLGVKDRRYYLLLLVPAAALVIWLYSGNTLKARFAQTNIDPATGAEEDTEAAQSARERRELLRLSLKVTGEYPLFGVGPGNFEIISGLWRVTHNSYTQISSEGGIPSFILYILILWRGIANLRRVNRYKKARTRIRLFSMALGASLAAYLLGSFFASDAYQLFPYCLVAYTSALSLAVAKEGAARRRTVRTQMTTAPVEVVACSRE